jgi:hypothetical protein
MKTAPASVNANSRNSAPVRPPWMPIGTYTAANVMVMAMTGPTSSRAPISAAWYGVRPSRMWRSTFSTTTIASSTTRPTDSTIASSVSRFSVKPNACIKKTPPISETGIATTGTSAERKDPRNRKITTITIRIVSVSVLTTSCIASRMYAVES